MKANELMIGDWVQIVEDAPIMSCECHQIDWIRTGELGLDNRKVVTYPYIKPIPLTTEILEKNGMAGLYGSNWPSDEYPNIELTSYEDGSLSWTINYNEYDVMSFEYVHELQHALRLCGVEKEITL